jgi:hypothetical protein
MSVECALIDYVTMSWELDLHTPHRKEEHNQKCPHSPVVQFDDKRSNRRVKLHVGVGTSGGVLLLRHAANK